VSICLPATDLWGRPAVSHICQNQADMGHPAFAAGIEPKCVSQCRGTRAHGQEKPQISPLRCASVEMTKGRAALPGRVVAEQTPFFIALGGPKAHDSFGRDDKEKCCSNPAQSRGSAHVFTRTLKAGPFTLPSAALFNRLVQYTSSPSWMLSASEPGACPPVSLTETRTTSERHDAG
jgi:hypothetical protein